jgi:iron complex outermembrane receptor protein
MLELGLRHKLRGDISAFGRVGRSVRFVTIDETFQANPSTYIMEFTPLAPQTALHADLGLDYTHGATRASATVYYMRLKNEIAFDPNTFANVNLDPTLHYGLELSGEAKVRSDLTLQASYTYLRSRFRAGPYDGRDVPLVPRHAASLSVLWDVAPRWKLATTARYVGRKHMDNYLASAQAGTDSTIPAYTLVDVKLTRRQGPWKVSAAVNNLFDRKVYDTAVLSAFTTGLYSAYPLPERTFTLSVSRQF